MKRPIFVAVIGYIIGIIMGLYFKSIVPFYIFIIISVAIYNINKKQKCQKLEINSFGRYFRYIKLVVNFKIIILILITSTISYKVVITKNKKYEEIYSNLEKVEVIGIVTSNKEEKEYNNKYEIKVLSLNGEKKKFYCYIDKKENLNIEYGDKVKIIGEYEKPAGQRNKGGFDYSKYLKTKGIYGSIYVEKIEIENKENINKILKVINTLKLRIIEKSKEIGNNQSRSIYLGIILGDTSYIEEQLKEEFRTAGIAHILAVSGMHVAYLIIGCIAVCKNIIGKRKAYLLTCIVIIFYIIITGAASSITRAGLMSILIIISKVIYKKNDTITSISFSLLITLIINPYAIIDVGLQLSYIGTIGIILLQPIIFQLLKKLKIENKKIRYKIPRIAIKLSEKIKEIISVSLSAQLAILPITLYHFSTFSSYFIITNVLVSIIIGPIFIIGIIYSISIFINSKIAILIGQILKLGIEILILITQIPNNLIGAKIYFPTPNIIQIIIYYVSILILSTIINIRLKTKKNTTQRRILNLIALAKYRKLNKKVNKIVILTILVITVVSIIPKNLKLNFVDVGQGDSTFIITPQNKTILVDGGGSSNFDIGKSTLLPYILKKGYTKIDYIIISHFDQDHIGRNINYFAGIKSW